VNDGRWVDENHGIFTGKTKPAASLSRRKPGGTVLARIPADRSFRVEDRTVSLAKGDLVACNRCHSRPSL